MSRRQAFGRIQIRPVERQLWIDGQPAVLGARAFDLLLVLAERRGHTVSKSELMDLVWSGLVVEENNLAVQVSTLRRLLGPQTIATIPGRGYRFTLLADDETGLPAVSTSPRRSPLPAAPASIIGRADDLDALGTLWSEQRLVTVLGAGGIGKTTLALSAAHRQSADGQAIAWVELASLTDAALIPNAIAQALDLPMGPGDAMSALLTSIRPVQARLVLDNAEHLIDAVAQIADRLLAAAAGLRLLVTSQAPLKVDGEWLFRVDALSLPPADATPAQALRHGAVALFDERAHAADRRFVLDDGNVALAIDLCRRLDGLPLAIRLAAARLPLFGLTGLHARLSAQLQLLGGGTRTAPDRQRTLRATHDWSHRLLSPAEQRVFRRLGVFVGGFTLASAAAVVQDESDDGALDEWAVVEALAGLVERSLVMADDRDEPRYRLLDSAREYALERLDAAGETLTLQRKHAERMLALMEQSIDDDHAGLPDGQWMARHGVELDDVRAAIAWSEVHAPQLAVALAGSARTLFRMLGLMQEAWHHGERLRPWLDDTTPTLAAARFLDLRSAGRDAVWHPNVPDDSDARMIEMLRAIGDLRGLYMVLSGAITTGDFSHEQRCEMQREMAALCQPDWSPRMQTMQQAVAAVIAVRQGRMEQARVAFVVAVEQARAIGREQQTARLLMWLGAVEAVIGASDDSVLHCREALALSSQRGASNVQTALRNLLSTLLEAGRLAEARSTIEQAVSLSQRLGWFGFQVLPLRFALFAALDGRLETAARLLGLSDHIAPDIEDVLTGRHRERTMALMRAGLGNDASERLMAQGAALDAPAACALTLDLQSP